MIAMAWAVLCAGIAGFATPSGAHRRVRARLDMMFDRSSCRAGRHDGIDRFRLRRVGAATAAGVSCAVVLGGPVGIIAGLVVGFGLARFLACLEPAHRRQRRARLRADLPVALDLLGACLTAGTPWPESVDTVAEAMGGPLGDELRGVAAQVRLGADPVQAWLSLRHEPSLLPLVRVFVRAVGSGAPVTARLARLATDERRRSRAAALARARTAGIRAVAPLGLCFLPAFVLLGVVPAVVGAAGAVSLP